MKVKGSLIRKDHKTLDEALLDNTCSWRLRVNNEGMYLLIDSNADLPHDQAKAAAEEFASKHGFEISWEEG